MKSTLISRILTEEFVVKNNGNDIDVIYNYSKPFDSDLIEERVNIIFPDSQWAKKISFMCENQDYKKVEIDSTFKYDKDVLEVIKKQLPEYVSKIINVNSNC